MLRLDILVTIPKTEYKNDDLENIDIENGSMAFWTLSRVPKELKVGDRVFFVKNNKIDSSMKVMDILLDNETTCETTGRVWKGKCQLILDNFKNEDNEEYIKGFQGYRYIESKSRLRRIARRIIK